MLNERAPVNNSAEMRAELSTFLGEHLADPTVGWPRPLVRGTSAKPKQTAGLDGTGLRILIVGDLELTLPIELQVRREEAVRALQAPDGEHALRWKMSELQPGGFVARAAPAAAALGADVSLCTILPVPLPVRIERFFAEHAISWRHVSALPGRCPLTVHARCLDGELVIHRSGVVAGLDTWLAGPAVEQFDIILVDMTNCDGPRTRLDRVLRDECRSVSRIGVRAGRTCADEDGELKSAEHVWTFLSHADAIALAGGDAGLQHAADQTAIARCLQDRYRINRLVVHSEDRAILANGVPEIHEVPACPVNPIDEHGAGDVLLTVTTISSALGVDDRTSLQRGVTAADGYSAGLELPNCLDELDVE